MSASRSMVGDRNRAAVRALLVSCPGIRQKEIAGVLGLGPVAVNKHVKKIRAGWESQARPVTTRGRTSLAAQEKTDGE